MTEISHRYLRVAEYLENEVGFEKWSRCHYPGLRYNITTTNMLNPVTYHVKGGELEGVVDIFNKTCTCKEFDIDKLPCVHAIAAAHHAQVSVYSPVSPYYTKEYYALAYGETIYPVGSQSQWDIPNEVTTRVVLPREVKERKRGRPKTSRFPSVGEFRKRKNRCGKCGAYGHYKKKCNSQTGST
ncbi:hypothetical protein UlMin_016927 [Ulmus minor]